MYQKRTYRNLIDSGRRSFFKVTVKETDLYIHARQTPENTARDLVLKYRGYIEAYIRQYPEFASTLTPWHISGPAPAIIRDMADAGQKAGVGPMAAVAGAMSEYVGRDLLTRSREVIVENGGDVFVKADAPTTIALFAGDSPLSLKIGLRIDAVEKPVAVCTSSGTVGHSLSLGKSDAVCVVSDACPLADAAATAIGNQVKSKNHMRRAIDFGSQIDGVRGLVVIADDQIGMWGDIEIVPLRGKMG